MATRNADKKRSGGKRLPSLLAAAKAAVAVHSPTHRPDQLRASTTLREAGVPPGSIPALLDTLQAAARSRAGEPRPAALLTGSLTLSDTVGDLARLANEAACQTFTFPNGANQNECQIWRFDSFFCRVKAAVTDWAVVLPPGGVKDSTKLDQLRAPFNDAACSALIQVIRNHAVFQPFNVTIQDVCGSLAGSTTVQGLAQVLWDRHAQPCKQFVTFP